MQSIQNIEHSMHSGIHSMHSGVATIVTSLSHTFPFWTRQQSPKSKIRYRYILAFLCMTGMAAISSTKVIHKVVVESFFKDVSKNKNRNLILSSYYWGYCLLGCLGGRLSEIYSAKWIILVGNALYLCMHLLTPLILRLSNVYVLLVSRIVSGLATGITNPAMIVLVTRWSPPAERYILCGIAFGGTYLGYTYAVFITMFLSTREHWEHSFYFSGGSVALWLIFHSVYVHDYPQIRKGLKLDELNYITSSLDDVLYDKKKRKAKTPWKSIMTSPPFYALIIVHTCIHLIFWLSFHRMIDDIKHFIWLSNMSQLSRGVLLSLPFVWALLVTLFLGLVFSTLIHQEAISKPAAIRFAVTFGLLMPVVCLTIDYFAESDWELVVIPMILVMVAGLNNMVQVNHIEISPNYAGTLMGISRTVSSFYSVVVRYIVPENVNKNRRRLFTTYGITILFSLVSMLIYILFLSADVQKWNWNLKESRRFSNIMKKEEKKDKGKDKNKDKKKGKDMDNKKKKQKDNEKEKKKDDKKGESKDNKKGKNKDIKNEKNKDNKKEKNKDNKKQKNKDNKKDKNKKDKNKDNKKQTKKKKDKPITLRTKQYDDKKKKKPKIKKKSKKETPKEDKWWFDWTGPSTSK